MDTQIDPTLYGVPASCFAMIVGSLLRPDKDAPNSATEAGLANG